MLLVFTRLHPSHASLKVSVLLGAARATGEPVPNISSIYVADAQQEDVLRRAHGCVTGISRRRLIRGLGF